MAEHSLEAEQAKIAAVRTISDKALKGIADNWPQLHPGTDAPTADQVRAEFERLTHPEADAQGKVPKYVTMPDGKLLPTAATIEEYGDAAASSVDKGTATLFPGQLGKWITMLVTAIQALFDWMSGGSASFTEAYAKITTDNISNAYEKELDAMGSDPEHAAFIKQHNLLEQGKDAIRHTVNVKAELEQDTPAFNLDTYLADPKNQRQSAAVDLENIEGANPQEKITGYMKNVVAATEKDFGKSIKALPQDKQQQLAQLKTELVKNGQALAGDPSANTPQMFAERVIKKTCADCKLPLPGKADDSLATIIGNLEKGSPDQKAQALVLTKLNGDLQKTQPFIHALATTGKELPPEEKAKLAAAARTGNAADAKKKLEKAETLVTDTVSKKVDAVVKDTAAQTVAAKSAEWGSLAAWGAWWKAGNEAEVIEKYKNANPQTQQEQDSLDAAKKGAYKVAVDKNHAPNQPQLDIISKTVGEAVAETIKNPDYKNADKDALAKILPEAIERKLESRRIEIDALGTRIVDMDKNNGASLIKNIASGTADAIQQDEALYKQLSGMRTIIQNAQTEVAVEQLKRDKPTAFNDRPQPGTLPNGHFVGAPTGIPSASPDLSKTV